MKKVALIYVGALIVFACVYPFLVRNSFSWIFSATLVLIIGSSTFVDNYFGIAYQMLLQADQKIMLIQFHKLSLRFSIRLLQQS